MRGSDQCVGALVGGELGIGPTTWLLGDRYCESSETWMQHSTDAHRSFMKNVYSVFSVDQKAVGFASLVTLA